MRNVRPNISKEKKEALKEIRSWNNVTVGAQDKGFFLPSKTTMNKYRLKLIEVHLTDWKKIQVQNLTFRKKNLVLKWHRKKVKKRNGSHMLHPQFKTRKNVWQHQNA